MRMEFLTPSTSFQLHTNTADMDQSMKAIVGILVEIGMGRSLTTIRSFGLLIEYMVRKVHMSLYINRPQVDRIKAAGARNPVLYLPTHRSYADFILFSYLCFYFDMEVPTVAAGMGQSAHGLQRLTRYVSPKLN